MPRERPPNGANRRGSRGWLLWTARGVRLYRSDASEGQTLVAPRIAVGCKRWREAQTKHEIGQNNNGDPRKWLMQRTATHHGAGPFRGGTAAVTTSASRSNGEEIFSDWAQMVSGVRTAVVAWSERKGEPMMSARETLTKLRHELAPDQDDLQAAAAYVMQELKRAAWSAKCEVTAEGDRLIISLPPIQVGPGAATRPRIAVQFVDGHFYVWKGSRASLDAVDGIEYEPVSGRFTAGKAPAVDRLAEIVAVRLGEELPLGLRSKMPPAK